LAVDAKPEIRYQRIVKRASETDNISFDTFLENEKREMNSEDPNKQNLSKCIKMADHVINNNGSIKELYVQLEKLMVEIH
jgi:dephospho-CoA kinase